MDAKIVANDGIQTTDLPSPHQKHCPLGYTAFLVSMLQSILFKQPALPRIESNRDHSIMKNESVKKSLEKSKNVLEKRRKVKQKTYIKTNKFTKIALNFVPKQSTILCNRDFVIAHTKTVKPIKTRRGRK